MKNAANVLKEDHKHIRRALSVLSRMAAASQRGRLKLTDAGDIVGFLRAFSDAHLMTREEEVVFPALLRGSAQRNYPRLCRFIFEHNRERTLVNGLEEAIRSGRSEDFAHYATRLVEVMESHIDKEAPELLELVDATLSDGEDERLAAELRNYDRRRRETILCGILKKLESLEARYGYGRGGGLHVAHSEVH